MKKLSLLVLVGLLFTLSGCGLFDFGPSLEESLTESLNYRNGTLIKNMYEYPDGLEDTDPDDIAVHTAISYFSDEGIYKHYNYGVYWDHYYKYLEEENMVEHYIYRNIDLFWEYQDEFDITQEWDANSLKLYLQVYYEITTNSYYEKAEKEDGMYFIDSIDGKTYFKVRVSEEGYVDYMCEYFIKNGIEYKSIEYIFEDINTTEDTVIDQL
jgi:hypothetical protein